MKKQLITLIIISLTFVQAQAQLIVSAHRGNSSVAPENTLAANESAIRAGADYFECDVRRTRDNVIVTLHDATLNRTTNASGNLSARTYAQLSNVDAGYADRFGNQYRGERIPTLEQVLRAAKGRIKVEIEIKESNMADDVVAMVQRLGMINDVIIIAFDFNELARVKQVDSRIAIKHLLRWNPFWGTRQLNRVRSIGGEYIGPSGIASSTNISRARDRGIKIISYTINSERDMQRAIDRGQYGIATDYPARAVALRNARKINSIEELEIAPSNSDITISKLVAFPNPIRNNFQLKGLNPNTAYTAELLDMTGKRVFTFGQVHNSKTIEFPDFITSGQYHLLIQGAGELQAIEVLVD